MALNQITISGNLVAEAEIRTVGDSQVAKFTVAVNDGYKKNNEWVDRSYFFDIVGWKWLAEKAQKATKGQPVVVSGKLTSRTYENKDGQKVKAYEIVANSLELFQRVATVSAASQANGNYGNKRASDQLPVAQTSDDLPF